MAFQQGKRGSTSKSSRNTEFHQLTNEAKKKYGVADVRPQDSDPSMLRFLRRTNLEIISPFPEKYQESLSEWVANLENIPIMDLPTFSMDMVLLQDSTNQDMGVVRKIRPEAGKFSVLAVDFEFHQQVSYDGFICVASVSSPDTTLIVDCLYSNREFATTWLKKMLTGVRVLKVFCGCDNDVFRMQKDWSCFANGVVDIQDMFLVWKRAQPVECFTTCKRAIIQRLQENNKQASESAVKQNFESLNKPGLDFMMSVFILNEKIQKDKVATYADWRVRPIAKDLVQYSACDSYYTLKIFYILYSKVGMEGVKAAAVLTIKKLMNRSSLPRYKNNIITTGAGQWVVEQILSWRMYLAQHLDYKPEQILNSKHLPELAKTVNDLPTKNNVEEIATLLKKYNVPDNFMKAAKLLTAYLDETGAQLMKMKNMICHACNHEGHVAKFCYLEHNPELKKAFLDRQENFERKMFQNNRRHDNYCMIRNLDPKTTTCPWEESPYHPKKKEV